MIIKTKEANSNFFNYKTKKIFVCLFVFHIKKRKNNFFIIIIIILPPKMYYLSVSIIIKKNKNKSHIELEIS